MTTPTSRTGAMPANSVRQAGFTLVELSLVILLFGISVLLVIPNLFRAGSRTDDYTRFSLWTEVVLERAAFRRQVVLLEIQPKKRTFKLVQPRRIMPDAEALASGEAGLVGDGGETATLEELQDPYLPSSFEWPASVRLIDVQAPDGTRYRDETLLVVVYPSGWIDPFTIHLQDEDGEERTGMVSPITGKVRWIEGYRERIRTGEGE